MLDFIQVPNKSSNTTTKVIKEIEMRYRVNDKVCHIVSDSASDLILTVKNLHPVKHIHCHRLHNTMIDSFSKSGLDIISTKIAKQAEDVNRNKNFQTEFVEFLKQERVTDEIIKSVTTRMKASVPTRWSSLHIKIKDFESKYMYIRDY